MIHSVLDNQRLDLWSSPLDGPEKVGKLHAGHLGRISYGEIIRINVRRKWKTAEQKEWWYAKFTMSRRRKLTKLFNRQKGLCVFCGCQTWLAIEGIKKQKPPAGMQVKQMATADHIIPQAHGGTDRMSNLAMACMKCNNDRQTMPFQEYMDVRNDPVKWEKRNRRNASQMRQRSNERQKKSNERRAIRIWNLALVLYLAQRYPRTD